MARARPRVLSGGRYNEGQWTIYRYGGSYPITLADTPRPPPILEGSELRTAVGRAQDVLSDGWRRTPFEKEGTVRAAMRSAFCLLGYGWDRSDRQAAVIVAEALRRMGARRPTWEQGQRPYTERIENCRWCGGPIEDDADWIVGFCSEAHGRAALRHWDFEFKGRKDRAYADVTAAIIRLKQKPVACHQCGRMFHPIRKTQKFCSAKCQGEGGRTVAERPCRNCGRVFRPSSNRGIFCSQACSGAYTQAIKAPVPTPCRYCGTVFSARNGQLYCRDACQMSAWMLRRSLRRARQIILTPIACDYILREAGFRVTDERMAA